MHQNKTTICSGAVDGNRTRLNLIDSEVPYPESYYGITWYSVRESNPSFRLERAASSTDRRTKYKSTGYVFFFIPKKFKVAVSILKLVLPIGIEPMFSFEPPYQDGA